MNILVTGANGQLGRTIRDVSKRYGHRCIFTSRTASDDIIALDVTDYKTVADFIGANAVDVIINCSGYTDVAGAESDMDMAMKLNSDGPDVLASAAKTSGIVLVHISSDYVFDGKSDVPYREDDVPSPLSVYGMSKLKGDEAVVRSGCKYLIFRTSWLYSCHGRNFFKTILGKVADMQSIKVVADQIGTPTYAADLAGAIFNIIDGGKLERTGLYNFSNEGICSWYDFAAAINEVAGFTCDVKPCSTDDYPSKVERPAYSVLDKSLFVETFGLNVPHWKDSLTVCMEEFRRNINK